MIFISYVSDDGNGAPRQDKSLRKRVLEDMAFREQLMAEIKIHTDKQKPGDEVEMTETKNL